MTYAGYLATFIAIPITVLALVAARDHRAGRRLPPGLRGVPAWLPIPLLCLVALVYTTPWDNYLVATGVWYYDPAKVLGVVFGWVPLEEYTFFVVETVLVGLWVLTLGRRLPEPSGGLLPQWRWYLLAPTAALWLASIAVLVSGWAPGTYLGLELAWFLPPIAVQLGFGGDILVRRRRLVLTALLSSLVYLSVADGLAIAKGIWTIAPWATVGILLGPLPLEELVFFSLTSALIVIGVTLLLASESHGRLTAVWRRVRRSPQAARMLPGEAGRVVHPPS